MKIVIIISLLLVVCHFGFAQELPASLEKKDLNEFGVGTIFTTDHSIIKNITLHEIKEFWIVYIKNGSLHDLVMEKIERIEFVRSRWGSVKIEFPENKPKISFSTTRKPETL